MAKLGLKDPQGYYVVVLPPNVKPRLEGDDSLERIGDKLIYRTRSRARAIKALRMIKGLSKKDRGRG